MFIFLNYGELTITQPPTCKRLGMSSVFLQLGLLIAYMTILIRTFPNYHLMNLLSLFYRHLLMKLTMQVFGPLSLVSSF
ncbi:hypothetical protein PEC301619_12220 [Pectobacterium carotovorum subsp. carotovorum]|nr:hypothetical protein PEC301619_12220 [Pectobacterium carotovorum subsp. carotovorum]GKW05899.1 hypothetical protein PEC301889_03820 [Pectobacterium carotovorum subsp. carotovorum]